MKWILQIQYGVRTVGMPATALRTRPSLKVASFIQKRVCVDRTNLWICPSNWHWHRLLGALHASQMLVSPSTMPVRHQLPLLYTQHNTTLWHLANDQRWTWQARHVARYGGVTWSRTWRVGTFDSCVSESVEFNVPLDTWVISGTPFGQSIALVLTRTNKNQILTQKTNPITNWP